MNVKHVIKLLHSLTAGLNDEVSYPPEAQVDTKHSRSKRIYQSSEFRDRFALPVDNIEPIGPRVFRSNRAHSSGVGRGGVLWLHPTNSCRPKTQTRCVYIDGLNRSGRELTPVSRNCATKLKRSGVMWHGSSFKAPKILRMVGSIHSTGT